MSYYNTTNQTNPNLTESREKAASMDELILRQFKRFPDMEISASMLHRGFKKAGREFLLTSIRRSLNTLKNDDHIYQTGNKKPSGLGGEEFLHKLNK